MKKKCLSDWLDAIESGKYKQTSGALKNEKGYCTLGILCELSKLGKWEPVIESNKLQYLGQINYLPKEVADWAGMTKEEVGSLTAFIITFNDSEKTSFKDLAKMLKKKYKFK